MSFKHLIVSSSMWQLQVFTCEILDKKLQMCRTATWRYPLLVLLSVLVTVRPHTALGMTPVVPICVKFKFPSWRHRTYTQVSRWGTAVILTIVFGTICRPRCCESKPKLRHQEQGKDIVGYELTLFCPLIDCLKYIVHHLVLSCRIKWIQVC
jgi:hypothetical protein